MPTKIEWCDETWNPIIGCSPISPGCANCYAQRMATRLGGNPMTPQYHGLTRDGKWTGETRFVEKELEKPLRWKKPRRVFVCSMGDLFANPVTNEQIAAVFGVMAACPDHTFLVLTKRPDRMDFWFLRAENLAIVGLPDVPLRPLAPCWGAATKFLGREKMPKPPDLPVGQWPWPLPSVHLGVTVCNQDEADRNVPILLKTPAAKRFVSLEPLLGPVDLHLTGKPCTCTIESGCRGLSGLGRGWECFKARDRLDQIIVGAETGPGARHMDPDWVRDIRDQCKAAGVPLFVKRMSNGEPIPSDLDFKELIK